MYLEGVLAVKRREAAGPAGLSNPRPFFVDAGWWWAVRWCLLPFHPSRLRLLARGTDFLLPYPFDRESSHSECPRPIYFDSTSPGIGCEITLY